jgi:undecaprenyl-diphosphatase
MSDRSDEHRSEIPAKAAAAAGDADELRHDQSIGPVDLTRWTTPPGKALAGTAEKASQNVGSRGALILILVVGGAIAIALSIIASRIYDSVTEADGVAGLDRPILDFMITLRSPALDSFVTAYTNIAGPIGMPILAVVAILILSLRRRSWTPAILIAAAGIGSLLMTIAGKDIIGRVRPPLTDAVPPYEYSPSFPSGHTLNALVIAGVVAYLLILRRKTTHGRVLPIVAAALFALTIGLSRVFLGHHWFTDVLAAWALGAAWLALIITAHRLYITARAKRPST